MEMCDYVHMTLIISLSTAILIIIEGQFQVFQRFPSSKPVLKTVESCFVALTYYESCYCAYMYHDYVVKNCSYS
jgi:hypothetical protein